MKKIKIPLSIILFSALTGCSSLSNLMNPFYETPPANALLGEKNDNALTGEGDGPNSARKALEAISQYRREQPPLPYNPVINPAVVRIVWIPDHVNANGDLVPAHYFYLKVQNEYWELQDAFELENQIKNSGNENLPFISGEEASKYTNR